MVAHLANHSLPHVHRDHALLLDVVDLGLLQLGVHVGDVALELRDRGLGLGELPLPETMAPRVAVALREITDDIFESRQVLGVFACQPGAEI